MATLAKCIEISGIHPTDGDRLQETAASYRKEGFKAQEANTNAVKDAIKEIESERKSIIAQVKKAKVPIAEKPAPEKPAEKELPIGEIGDFNISNLAQRFLTLVKTGEKLNKLALQSKVAEMLGISKKEMTGHKDYSHKQVEEAFEYAIVMRAREIVAESDTVQNAYDALKALHNAQPLLSTRTSTSVKQQMYSTPVHLAYLAQVMAEANKDASVYEPSGGTGMLVTATDAKNILANEIDKGRVDILKDQGIKTLRGDGTDAVKRGRVAKKSVDAVMANPPFGGIPPIKIDGYNISKIEHQMIADALGAMKDDGTAAFIIGGKNFDKGKMNNTQKVFLNWLYSKYYVKHNIDIPGKEYSRQGATFPIRLIVVDGRKKIERGAAPAAEDQYQSVESIDELLTGGFVNGSLDASKLSKVPVREAAPGDIRAERVEGVARELPAVPRPEDKAAVTRIEGERRIPGRAPERPPTEGIPEERPAVEPKGARPARPAEARPVSEPARGEPIAVVEGEVIAPVVEKEVEIGRREPGKPEGVPKRVRGAEPERVPGTEPIAKRVIEYQSIYEPKSKGPVVDETLMPRNMYESVMGALDALEKEVGPVDDYVKDKLQFKDTKALFKVLSSDQIDAVALSVRNIDKGVGMIVGDQTGVGKGRIAAAVIRYAQLKGKKPVFFTEKPNLFTDFYRDIVDIGHDVDPFIMASNIKLGTILDKKGRPVYVPPNPKERRSMLEETAEKGVEGLGEHDSTVATYSQVNKANAAQKAIASLAAGNIMVLDESHNASGDSSTGKFLKGVLEKVDGILYMSATFAKRPDTMPLYFRTALSDANLSMEELVSAINVGGLPLQEIVSSALGKLGQYVRREKSFKGININSNFNTAEKKVDTERANGLALMLGDIVKFDKTVGELVDVTQANLDAGGAGGAIGDVSVPGSQMVGGKSVASTVTTSNFASVVHNAIRQALLSMKADMAADFAIKELKAGRKPIIALSNTMGAFVKDQIMSGEISEGDAFNLTMKDIMKRHLRRSLQVTITSPQGDKTKTGLPIEMLPNEAQAAYKEMENKIDAMPGGDLTGNPIDYIKARLIDAGYAVDELTGRDYVADLTDPKNPTLTSRTEGDKAARNVIVSKFNNGQTDCLIVNAAGATGLSLHAAPGFKDKRPRTYIGLQAELNVDTEIQKMGRINRKGQVALPSYQMLFLDLPTEIRPAAVLAQKLKSLSANTSAGADSPMATKTLPDMMNKYGDQVTAAWVNENREIAEAMGVNPSDDMHKITGRLALQPVYVQEEFYEQVEQEYIALIEMLKEEGRYDLEVGDVDFNAETLDKKVLTQGQDEKNPFGASSYREELSVALADKPYNKKRIENIVKERLGRDDAKTIRDNLIARIEKEKNAYLAEKKKELSTEDYEKLADHVHETFMDINDESSHLLIGKKYILDSKPAGRVGAVLIDVRMSKAGTGNPAIKSRIKLVYAVNSAMQKMTVPLFRIDAPGENGVELRGAQDYMWNDWDKTVTESLKYTRYMITGNLLQGYADAPSGSMIVRYTTKDAGIKEGILLPVNYEPSAFEDNVRITNTQAVKLITDVVTRVNSDNVVIDDTHDGFFDIIVPKSKLRGGRFFLDEKLLSMVAREFETRAGFMVARVSKENLGVAVNRICELGEVFRALRSDFDSAFGKEPKEVTSDRDIPLFMKRETTVSKGTFGAVGLQSLMDKITGTWENAPTVKVVQSQFELPQDIQDYIGKDIIVDGVYFRGEVHIVADNQSSIEGAITTLLHETFGHYGIRGSLGKDFGKIMQEVYIAKKDAIDKIASEYDLDIKTMKGRALAAEEWLAREAASNPTSGWVSRLVAAIRKFIRRIMPSLSISDTEIHQLLEEAKGFVERTAPKKAKRPGATTLPPGFQKEAAETIDTAGFLPPEVEKQVAEAKGVAKVGFKEELSETLTKVKAQRYHFPDLQSIEDKALRAKVSDVLRRHQEVPETAKNMTIQKLDSFIKGLSEDGYKVYRMNIFLADMMRDIRNGLTYDGKLPFGFKTTKDVEAAYAKYKEAADKHPQIAKALKRRTDDVNNLKKRLVKAKLLKKEVLKDDDYFHHQIIKYWNAKHGMATGSKDVRTHWRPWMAARKGSMLNYNTDYIEAEYSAISQQLEQLLTVETLERLKRDADIYAKLKRTAKTQNIKNLWDLLREKGLIKKHPKTGKEIDPFAPWKKKIAMANTSLAKMANNGSLEYDSEWKGLVDELARSFDAWKNKDGAVPGQPHPGVNDPRWFDFLSYLINTKKPGSNWAATILKSIRDRDKFVADTLEDKFLTYSSVIPEGYVEWKPDPGKGWYWANVVTDKILEKMQKGELDPKDVEARQLLAKGSDLVWIIPEGLAKTMDGFRGQPEQSWIGHVADRALRAWKQYILLNPYSVVRYNMNNTSGDLDACLAYAPEITKYAKQSLHDLRLWHKRGELASKTQEEIDFTQASGAIQSGFSMQEVDDAKKVLSVDKIVKDVILDEQPNWFTKAEWFGVKTAFTSYWQFVRRMTAIRENVLRLSAYRFFMDNKDKRLYGASKPDEIDAITDPREKAAKLSRELFGDYGNISKSGEYIRKRLMPFYSWMEINTPRYVYLMRNTKYENRDVDSVKKQMAAVAGKKLVLSSAKMALRASMLMGAVTLWNLTMFPDEEEELGESGRRQMHIILGRREDGSIITLRFQGALSDALSFFGLEDWPADMKDLLEGKRTVGEKLKEIPLALLNRGVQAIRPEPKMLGELISGKAFYPDVTRPLPIRDRMEHVLRTFKLEKIYRAALERPARGVTPGAPRGQQMVEHFLNDLKSMFVYEADPGLLAYYDTRGMVFDWLAKQGDERRFGGRPTKKGNAFYYYKQAMKFGDLDAAQRYLKKYYELGGTVRTARLSIKHAHPLSSLPKMRRQAFRQSLDAKQETRLKSALEWYGKTYR